ncbi:MAG: efflux RND transporter periplasmic adaptor subunit [Gemmataceae bacterium]|nr:efflux RND transporter periplasmic adaptor subunit [Gemmataceae bacterium]
MRSILSIAWRGIAGFVFGGLLVGCGPKSPESNKKNSGPTAQSPVLDFQTVAPKRISLIRKVDQPGTVEPFEETQIFAKIPGFVSVVNADIGQRVRGPSTPFVPSVSGSLATVNASVSLGEILAEVSIPEMEEEAKQKLAQVTLAETEVVLAEKTFDSAAAQFTSMEALVNEAKAGVRRAQAQLDRWESESARVAGLVQRGIADAQTRDQVLGEFRSASANRDESMAKLVTAEANTRKSAVDREKAKAGIQAALAMVGVAKSEAKRLQAMLGYTKIRAPYDGIITRRKVNTGDFLSPGRIEPLFTLSRFEPLRLVVFVPEADAGLVQPNTPIHLRVQALRGFELQGKISRTSWSLDPGTRTLRAEIDVPNPGERLRPGMYVYATLQGNLPESWVLPTSSLVKQGENLICFRVVDGKTQKTPVQVGHTDGLSTEILKWQTGPGGNWTSPDLSSLVCIKGGGIRDGIAVGPEN